MISNSEIFEIARVIALMLSKLPFKFVGMQSASPVPDYSVALYLVDEIFAPRLRIVVAAEAATSDAQRILTRRARAEA